MKKILLVAMLAVLGFAEPIDDYIGTLKSEVLKSEPNFQGFSIQRGEKIFTSKHVGKKGERISCASCHGSDFRKSGKHYFTGKTIDPLSRETNPKSLTSKRNVQKWLRRNFKDVYNRLGTPKEKGDVLVYMLSKSR